MFICPGLCRLGRPTFLICLGFLFGTLAMTYPAVLKHYIYIANPCDSFVSCGDLPSFSAWIQVLQDVLTSVSGVFTSITDYTCMKNVVMRIVPFMTSIGNEIIAVLA